LAELPLDLLLSYRALAGNGHSYLF